MRLKEKIKDRILPAARKHRVTDVRIGLGYTAVGLDVGTVGVAYTFISPVKRSCNVFNWLRPLAGRQASELLSGLDSADDIETAVAMATVNALAPLENKPFSTGDMLKELTLYPHDCVGVVGNFAPILPRLKKRCASVKVFERIDFAKGGLLPYTDIPELIPECQVAVITSTAIINNTVDAVLEAAAGCREVVMLGASTPMIPDAFTDTPVTLLSGVKATHPETVLQVVSEGGGMRSFGKYIQKVNISVER
ncbi:MAG: DUF364 domain-containing protein [Desulfobacterales bacterium]